MRHADQLRKLADGLARIPEDKFDIWTWGLGTLKMDSPTFDCDFSGCAMGWFPRLVPEQTLVQVTRTGIIVSHGELYGPFEAFKAIAAYFDIQVDDAMHLFSGNRYTAEYGSAYVSPSMVARRIHQFLGDTA